ncbi:MAG: sulfatase family protein [Opitutaceae bacterium]
MKRNGSPFSAALSLCMLALTSTIAVAAKPNIIVILADDVGSGDISFYRKQFMSGKPVIETKAIDSLAEGGMWFTDAHSSTALCAPTRYAIMSGKNNYRSFAPWGVWNSFYEGAIKKGDTTLGTVARDGGYSTGFIGKWHLGLNFEKLKGNGYYRGNDRSEQVANADMTEIAYGGPKDMGFDYGYALPTGIQGPLYLAYENEKWAPLDPDSKIIAYNTKNAKDPATVTQKDKDELEVVGNLTISDKGPGMGDSHWDTSQIGEILARKASDFIDANSGDDPFFLYYCSPHAHRPHIPPVEMFGEKVYGTLPSRHLEIVKVLDLEVQHIIEALKRNGEYENTLILFSADNGGLTWKVPGTMESGHRPSGLYRGAKSAPHEGGHRVPFIAHWPAKIKAGQFSDELVITHDFMATVAKIAGTQLTDEESLDSTNILPILLGDKNYNSRDSLVMQAGASFEVMYRVGDWKLIIQSNHKLDKWEPIALFNLKSNTSENESKNLLNHPEYKSRAQKMYRDYMRIRESGVRTAPINP